MGVQSGSLPTLRYKPALSLVFLSFLILSLFPCFCFLLPALYLSSRVFLMHCVICGCMGGVWAIFKFSLSFGLMLLNTAFMSTVCRLIWEYQQEWMFSIRTIGNVGIAPSSDPDYPPITVKIHTVKGKRKDDEAQILMMEIDNDQDKVVAPDFWAFVDGSYDEDIEPPRNKILLPFQVNPGVDLQLFGNMFRAP